MKRFTAKLQGAVALSTAFAFFSIAATAWAVDTALTRGKWDQDFGTTAYIKIYNTLPKEIELDSVTRYYQITPNPAPKSIPAYYFSPPEPDKVDFGLKYTGHRDDGAYICYSADVDGDKVRFCLRAWNGLISNVDVVKLKETYFFKEMFPLVFGPISHGYMALSSIAAWDLGLYLGIVFGKDMGAGSIAWVMSNLDLTRSEAIAFLYANRTYSCTPAMWVKPTTIGVTMALMAALETYFLVEGYGNYRVGYLNVEAGQGSTVTQVIKRDQWQESVEIDGKLIVTLTNALPGWVEGGKPKSWNEHDSLTKIGIIRSPESKQVTGAVKSVDPHATFQGPKYVQVLNDTSRTVSFDLGTDDSRFHLGPGERSRRFYGSSLFKEKGTYSRAFQITAEEPFDTKDGGVTTKFTDEIVWEMPGTVGAHIIQKHSKDKPLRWHVGVAGKGGSAWLPPDSFTRVSIETDLKGVPMGWGDENVLVLGYTDSIIEPSALP